MMFCALVSVCRNGLKRSSHCCHAEEKSSGDKNKATIIYPKTSDKKTHSLTAQLCRNEISELLIWNVNGWENLCGGKLAAERAEYTKDPNAT